MSLRIFHASLNSSAERETRKAEINQSCRERETFKSTRSLKKCNWKCLNFPSFFHSSLSAWVCVYVLCMWFNCTVSPGPGASCGVRYLAEACEGVKAGDHSLCRMYADDTCLTGAGLHCLQQSVTTQGAQSITQQQGLPHHHTTGVCRTTCSPQLKEPRNRPHGRQDFQTTGEDMNTVFGPLT